MTQNLSYEKAFERLEKILEMMNSGKTPLEESLKLFEEAENLMRSCTNSLNTAEKTIINNRKARHDYEVLDSFEAGIVLKGSEVKSLREGNANMQDCYAVIRNGEIWLMGMHINPYKQANLFNHDPLRDKKLLLHKGYSVDFELGLAHLLSQ